MHSNITNSTHTSNHQPSPPAPLSKQVIHVTVARPPKNSTLGIIPNEHLELVRIQSNSPAFKHLRIGDRVLLVNNKAVATQDQLMAALQSTDGGPFVFTVKRDVHKMVLLPADREHLVVRHAGFDYPVVSLQWSRVINKRVGLHVKESCNKVLVARTEVNTAAADCLRAGDRIVDVNGTPVTCRTAAKTLICESLANTQTASMIIERPNNAITLNDIMRQIHLSINDKEQAKQKIDEPSLPIDCIALLKKEIQRRSSGFKSEYYPRSQMKAPVTKMSAHPRRSVQLASKVTTVLIGQDTEPTKYLRQVGRRHS